MAYLSLKSASNFIARPHLSISKPCAKLTVIAMSLLLSGCNSLPSNVHTTMMNKPISSEKPINRFLTSKIQKKRNDLMIVLTFSGGGTRAAALSYGVMKALNQSMIPRGDKSVSLLSEVDVISSVSGGSFTSAYYGLFGNKLFTDYEKDFLKRPVQSNLLNAWLFSPSNWPKLATSAFNRTDLAADYYDKYIFKSKKFSDMREDVPQIIINTTDVSTGNSFSFTPEDMRWVCSNLSDYPVSRAVAASSAVPGAFTPITLKNHAGCQLFPYQNKAKKPKYRIDEIVLDMRKYLDKKKYPYLHLVDGGVSDNLGVRAVLKSAIDANDHFPTILKTYGLEKTKKVVFIIVNASDDIPPEIAQSKTDPGVENVLGAVMTVQFRRYNLETLDLLNQKFKKWKKQLQEANCNHLKKEDCNTVDFYAIELNLKQLPKKLAEETSLYPTSLELPSKQVDTLIESGEYLLKASPKFQQLLQDLDAK